MKEYHTKIAISASADTVWKVLTDFSAYPEWNPLVGWLKGDISAGGGIQMFIKPLDRSFSAKLKQVQEAKEIIWVGVQFAPWFISGEHYYRLEPMGGNSTLFRHGEYFRGLGSAFIGEAMLQKMEKSFIQHNRLLKERVENG